MKKGSWFESWFDSPYYHILYKKRDDKEAQLFLDNLIHFLHPEKDSAILDLACGRGRHSIHLHKKGFNVTGVDLSEENIKHNKKYENPTLSFHVHDMREVFKKDAFDYVFNLFTSFGYFENEEDNIHTLTSVNADLKKDGILVLDYINSNKASKKLIRKEHCVMGGIDFDIERKVSKGYIEKNISFCGKGKDYHFTEKVQMITLQDFQSYFKVSGFEIKNLFGDYKLNPFDENNSDRLIIIAQKTKEV